MVNFVLHGPGSQPIIRHGLFDTQSIHVSDTDFLCSAHSTAKANDREASFYIFIRLVTDRLPCWVDHNGQWNQRLVGVTGVFLDL